MTGSVFEVGGRLILRLPPGDSWSETVAMVEQVLGERRPGTGAEVILDSGPMPLATEQLLQVERVLRQHGCQLVRVVHGPPQEPALTVDSSGGQTAAASRPQESRGRTGRRLVRARRAGEQMPDAGDRTLIRRGPIRSGQVIRYEGNVVILGDVNPGAQIIAAGDVVVMGTLRGVAHAGATGSRRAVVAALRLCPTQLRIADLIRRAPEDSQGVPGGPELACVKGSEILVETL